MRSSVYEADAIGRKVADELLRDDVKLFEIGGQVLFPVYAMSGGIALRYMLYLIKEGTGRPKDVDLGRHGLKDMGGGWKAFAIEVNIPENEDELRKKVAEGLKELA